MTRDYYEPWHPQLGDRVRVRLSGECPVTPPEAEFKPESFTASVMREIDWPEKGHPEQLDGVEGTVDKITHEMDDVVDWWHGHWYGVWFDQPVKFEGGILCHGLGFAAVELEPLGTRGEYGKGHWPELRYDESEIAHIVSKLG